MPVLEETALVALLYVDSQDPHFCDAHDLERLAKFSRIVAKSVQDSAAPRPLGGTGDSWEAYLERTPVEDMEREKLLLLLNRNEWNIARVARLMSVTRRTVYLRLQRYNIPRERVPKTRPAAEHAPEDAPGLALLLLGASAQVSFSVTVRLKTERPGCESGSAQK